ncbi:MAG TPA: hypothetical protein VL326_21625 [Kofleriaceae bacterium]|jgi:hypothetical protein|nr:hypothetical protein [Kofleriaceae bacterium]
MARIRKSTSKPGTERFRDEKRNDPKPKMHGKQWRDLKANPVEGVQGSKFGTAVKGPVRATREIEKSRPKVRGRNSRG